MGRQTVKVLAQTCLRGLFMLWSAYLSALTCAFFVRAFGIERKHLDSAWLIEATLAIGLTLVSAGGSSARVQPKAQPKWTVVPLVGFGAAAVAVLYWPSLSFGLLSDDFTLLERATTGVVAPAHELLFRPLPVAMWAGIVRVLPFVAVPGALHVVNLLLHGVNAILVTVLARRLHYSRAIATLTGALFVAFPSHVEAVAWASGIQDVLAAALVLAFLCRLSSRASCARDAQALLLVILALLTKESAVAACVIGAGWCLTLDDRGQTARRLWVCAATCVTTVAYVVWRLALVGDRLDNQPSTTRRGIAHFLTSPFAALGSPWSVADLDRWPEIGLVPCLLLLVVVVLFVARSRPRRQLTQSVLLLLCALAAVAPVGRYFFIAPDLEGSRYLYLPSVFWVLFIGFVLDRTTVHHERMRLAVATGVAAVFAVGVWIHLGPWRRAGQSRDALLHAIDLAVERDRCLSVVVDPPDNVDGAYVFRNGLADALALSGKSVRLQPSGDATVDEACRLHGTSR